MSFAELVSVWDQLDQTEVSLDLGISKALLNFLDQTQAQPSLSRVYDVNFPERPFRDIVQEIHANDLTYALGGIGVIQEQLALKQCHLNQKDITAILYYFSDDFRKHMALQIGKHTLSSPDLFPQRTPTEAACKAFNHCYYPGT